MLGFFLLLQSYVSYGQEQQLGSPYLHNYNPSEYQEDPQNWAVVQDKRGVLYFGNTNGIIEYDGRQWNTIKVSNASLVWSLAVDKNGIVYAGAIGDFGYLFPTPDGKMTYHSLTEQLPEKERDFVEVKHTFANAHGVYFIGKNKIFRLHNGKLSVLNNGQTNTTAYEIKDTIFVVNPDGIRFIQQDEVRLLPHTIQFGENTSHTAIVSGERNGILTFVNQEEGFFSYNLKRALSNTGDSVLQHHESQIQSYLKSNGLNHAISLPQGNIALATNGGVAIVSEKGKLIQLINKHRGLSVDFVNYLFADNAHSLWLALDGGIAKVKPNSPITRFDQLNGLEGTVLSYCDYNGRKFVGSTSGLYIIPNYELKNKNDKHELIKVQEVTSPVWKMFSHEGRLFVGASNGIFVIDRKMNIQHFPTLKTYDFTISPTRPNTLFLAQYGGIAFLDLRKITHGTLQTNDIQRVQEASTLIWNFTVDRYGDIWASSFFTGIYQLKLDKNSSNIEVRLFDKEHGIPEPYNNLYIQNADDTLLLSTPDGIYSAIRPDRETAPNFSPCKQYKSLKKGEDLKQVKHIQTSGGRTWVISKKNIGYFEIKQRQATWEETPFFSKPIYIHSLYPEKDASWICTNEGLFRFSYESTTTDSLQFNCLIRSVKYNADSIIFSGAFPQASEHDKAISAEQPKSSVPIFKGSTSISFDFSASTYEKESATQYRFKLGGFDKKWSDWALKTNKEYTNLSSGKYIFEVQAMDIRHNISPVTTYRFVVRPPFYKHPFAFVLYSLLVLLLIFCFIKIYTRRLKRLNKKLEDTIQARTQKIVEQKNELAKQASALEASNKELAKLSIVASNTDSAITIMDSEGNFEWINEGFTRLYGYDLIEYIAVYGESIIAASSNENIKTLIKQCITDKKSTTYESKNKSKDGRTIWAHTTLTPITNSNNDVIQLVGIDSDITKLKEVEQEILKQSEELKAAGEKLEQTNKELEQLSIVASKTDNAVMIMDAEGNYEWVNESFERMFGFTLKQMVQAKGGNIKNSDKQYVIDAINSCISEKKSVQYEFPTHIKSGVVIWVQATVTPILNENEEIVKLIAVDSNITKLKKAEEKVKRHNENIQSSIRYAQTIQKAILPIKEITDKYFESFNIFRPKDIVSGDFMWYSRKYAEQGIVFAAVVDCTGHGVPGAFMSMIGSRLLNEIVNEKGTIDTAEILEMLHTGVRKALKQDRTDNNDGMDVCLCRIERKENELDRITFSGAKRPLYIVKNKSSELETIKGDRRTIGGVRSRRKLEPFTSTTIELSKGDMVYLSTDGLVDQNGKDRTRFGSKRFLKLLQEIHKLPIDRQSEEILSALQKHQGKAAQRDDITITGIRI